MMPDSIPVSVLRGGTSRGVFFRDSELPDDPGERRQAILGVFGAGGGGVVDGLGGENPVLRKVAIVGPGEPTGRGLPALDYTFGQVDAELTRVDHTLECGNIASAVPLFGAVSGWCPRPARGSQVLVNLVNTARRIRAEWLDGGRLGGALTLWLLDTASRGRQGSLVYGEATTRLVSDLWGPVRCTVLRSFNTHLFIDGRDVALPDPLAPDRLPSDTFRGLSELARAVGSRSGQLENLKVSIVAPWRSGGLQARTVFPLERRDHPSVAVTGGAAISVAACIEGTVVRRATGGDPGAELGIRHLGGSLSLALRRGPDGLPSEVGVERSCRLILEGRAYPGRPRREASTCAVTGEGGA